MGPGFPHGINPWAGGPREDDWGNLATSLCIRISSQAFSMTIALEGVEKATAAGRPVVFPARATDDDLVEAGRHLFARPARFVAGAAEPAALPPESLPEIAFAGRSNVGKSSLVNALTGRHMLARTSNTPGRTRQINFFDLAGVLLLVDLPGYGYAEASKTAAKRWSGLVRAYLRNRATLRRVCLLVDARHGLKDIDRELLAMLDRAAVSYQIVLTKSDKLAVAALHDTAGRVASEIGAHTAAHPEIHLTSAQEQHGIAALRGALAALAPALPIDVRQAGALPVPGPPR
jgi:GTP-binding protein